MTVSADEHFELDACSMLGPPTGPTLIPAELRRRMEAGTPMALIDVREHGEYNAAHIPGASSVPRRLLEQTIDRLVPTRHVPVVLYDDDGRRALLAGETLSAMGYGFLDILTGGINRWASEGYPTEWGMNVPSKDFGEMVEVRHHVPSISATDLKEKLDRGEDLVILDTRTPEEFQRACIPGGQSVPGAELPLRIADIVAERPNAQVVVNCAGRTRSIIGTRTLQRMGLEHVVGLRNGTSGWSLAGLELERGAQRLNLGDPSPEGRARAEAFARRVAQEDGVRALSVDGLRDLMSRADRVMYFIDVRSQEEFETGHIPGFTWVPGGQAVQRVDDTVAIRSAHVVFSCDSVTRSFVTASWYRQMGFRRVYAVDGGTDAWAAAGHDLEGGSAEARPFGLDEAERMVPTIDPGSLANALASNPDLQMIFVDTSREFSAGHIPGARWLSRSWLELNVVDIAEDLDAPLVITDVSGRSSLLAALTLAKLGYRRVGALAGGMKAWQAAGLAVEQGLTGIMDPPTDVVPAGTERSYADMVQYLRWEEALGQKYEQAVSAPS
ncbi:MAG: rhodanese-like domain-containing protein [Chloroflexota bacterium]